MKNFAVWMGGYLEDEKTRSQEDEKIAIYSSLYICNISQTKKQHIHMKTNKLWIAGAACLCLTMLTGCSCKKTPKNDQQETNKTETFVTQPGSEDGSVQSRDNESNQATQPSSPSGSQQKPKQKTNDNDPNLRGYHYKYDKNTAYEDGIFRGTPDYIAIPAKIHEKPEQILYRKSYAVSYNKQTKQPNWVAWHLTKDHTYGNLERPPRAFHDDEDVPNSTHYYDYNKSKQYDRGHLCPAGDNKWDEDAMYETFLMSNVCPQYHDLNSGVWNDIEIKCREWARQEGDVYVVAGPYFYPNKRNRELIGGSKIPVPDAFFKVVLSNKHKGKGIGFLCENRHGSSNLNDYSMTIDEIEQMTGIDFFPALPDEMENRVESEIGRFR